METKHLILALVLSIYYFIHSFFLHPPIKSFFIKRLYFNFKVYRLTFNLFAIIGLVFIFLYSKQISEPIWFNSVFLKVTGILVILVGVFLTYKSFKNYNIKEFIGITAESTDTLQNNLVVTGYHKYVRHPVYTATIIIFIGYLLYYPNYTSLILLVVTFLYLQVGIYLEEKKLIKKFGKSYENYKNSVPKLFPVSYKN